MKYVGIDSAWGGRLPGALCELEDGADGRCVELREAPRRMSWPEMIRLVRAWQDEPRIVLIDQPLVVTNRDGMRPVERDINAGLVAAFGCGAYPANLSNRVCFGPRAGVWGLLDALESRGLSYDPAGAIQRTNARAYLEGYPHLALLGLFDLPRTLRYKVHKREPAEWTRLLAFLESLTTRDDLRLVYRVGFLATMRDQTKANEDLLDSLVCAYAAAWIRRRGADGSAILGDAETGAITTPVSAGFRERLRQLVPADRLNRLAPGRIAVPRPPADGDEGGEAPAVASAPSAPRGPRAPSSRDGDGDCPDGFVAVDLVATDTGNLWANRRGDGVINPWFDVFEGVRLQISFRDEDGAPLVELRPFLSQGAVQRGMRPTEEYRDVWAALVEGCSRVTPKTYRVCVRYLPLP